jgi:hypothetical protein
MKRYFFLLGLSFTLFATFQDAELESVWASIANIDHPTLAEYQLLDQYLSTGARPYLDGLRHSDYVELYRGRLNSILNFRLVGPANQLPLYEKYQFGSSERCIVLFGSSNGIYPKKARRLLREIENSGYNGHVLLRIGGFPNTESGGLKICHVPYAFKVAFLQEARELGYKKVLWMDLAIHPLGDFETIFRAIESKGYFFTDIGTLRDNFHSHLSQAALAVDITPDLYQQIPHISSSMIGLNMEDSRAVALLKTWYLQTERVYPNITWWPEELNLSVAAWRLGCTPYTQFGKLVCGESEQFQLENRPEVEFYLDGLR